MARINEIDNIHYVLVKEDYYGKNIKLSKKEIKIMQDYEKLSNKLWHIFNCIDCNRTILCFTCNEQKRKENSKLKKYILD